MEPINIINLTPHDVNYYVQDEILVTFPVISTNPDDLPRCEKFSETVEIPGLNFKTYKTRFGEVNDLPEPADGVFYIVSALVRDRRQDRKDLLSPTDAVRDEKGRVIGCRGFDTNH